MAKSVEIWRHTDSDGDVLTAEGVRAAVELGARLDGGYDLAVSSGAHRATQTLACMLAGLGEPVAGGVVVDPGLRSARENDWRAIYGRTRRSELAGFREADPDFVAEESQRLGDALDRILDGLPDGGRALAVGHSPTNEAAVYGLTGQDIAPLGKGQGARVIYDGKEFVVAPLG